MSGFFRNPRNLALAAAALALAGAAGWGLALPAAAAPKVLLDGSESCAAAPRPGATRFDHSDLMRAVREAGGPRVTLYTDGCDTSGKPPVDPGFPVDVVLAPRRDLIQVLALGAPDRCGLGAPIGIRVTVGRTAGPAAPPASVRVRLLRDGQRVGGDRTIRLERGQQRSINFVDSLVSPGVARYEAWISGGRGGPAAFVRAGDEPQIGVVGEAPAWEGFEFRPARPGVPCDAYLVTGRVADPALRAAIETRVREGAGLLAGGAADLSLLPLTEHPPEGRAVVVLLDVSGSMEPHLAALRQGFFELCARLDPTDRVALVRFRGGVVDASGWRDAATAPTLWTTPVARGNTELQPALDKARELLDGVKARYRRLYVISDGEWGEVTNPPDLFRAALFVTEEPPEAALRLFPIHARGAAVLTTALRALEEAAPDRWVRQRVVGRRGAVPGWLRGALPEDASFADFPRLYAKGLDEQIALAAGEIPLVAAREEGGRIVQAVAPTAAMLRACLADSSVRLRAWREGRALRMEATGGGGAPFRVGERSIAAHAAGPDRHAATLDAAPPGRLVIRCAGAATAVPALADAETAGLFPDEAYARALARVSGGSFRTQAASNPQRRPAVYATLLGAALLLLASAWFRRR